MDPAFRSNREVVARLVLLLCLLMLPLMIRLWRMPPRREAWLTLANDSGLAFEVQHVFESRRNDDVVFVGSSPIRHAIDPKRVEDIVGQVMRRPIHVFVLALEHQGFDEQFFLLRDYLAHHHSPKVIAISEPYDLLGTAGPHKYLYRWLRLGDDPDVFKGISPVSKTQLYASFLLGAPRQILNDLRTNLPVDAEFYTPDFWSLGWLGKPFSQDVIGSPIASDGLLTANSPLIGEAPAKLPGYAGHYFDRLQSLALDSGAKVVLLHVNPEADYLSAKIHTEVDLRRIASPRAYFVGFSNTQLFPVSTRERQRHFYYDNGHMNRNGAERFSEAVAVPIAKLLNGTAAPTWGGTLK